MTKPIVAVFDVDGTITKRDTFLPFLRTLDARGLRIGLVRSSPWIMMSLFDRTHRDRAKEILLHHTLSGRPVDEVRVEAERFADKLVPDGLVAAVLDRLEHHRAEGHRIVAASASPEMIVEPIAGALGIDDVIATRLEVVHGRYTGYYDGSNARSDEKLRRVIGTLGCAPSYAYGNLPDDEPLLNASANGFVVKGERLAPYAHRSV